MSMLRVPPGPDDHVRGSLDAPVVIVEYGDYECAHCGAAHPNVLQLMLQFGDQIALVFRHFPLMQVHPHAESAAESAEFAGGHGMFWEMHDGLYENQDRIGLPLLFALAGALRLSESELRAALTSRRYLPEVRDDFMSGVRSGVNGTPTFFINGERHNGTYAFDDLAEAVQRRLLTDAPA
jgi:protein-disulfide isomerase